MTVSPLSIFIREKNSAKYINYNRSAWNHRIAAYEDLSGYEQADVDCSGDQCTEDKSECISGCTEGSECGKSGAGAARAIWCYAQVKQIIKGPEDSFRVLVTGLQSAKLESIEEYVPNLIARVTVFESEKKR